MDFPGDPSPLPADLHPYPHQPPLQPLPPTQPYSTSGYEHPTHESLAIMEFNSARDYSETTPLMNLSAQYNDDELIPPDLVSINSGDNVITSSRYNKVSGKYVEVPQYNNNGQLTASKTTINVVLLTVMFQSVGFTLVLPSMYLYLKSVCLHNY